MYNDLSKQILSLAEEDAYYIPLLSNISAILYENLVNINWAGFYLLEKDTLVLGPFQGKPACIHIPLGKGVCGTAALSSKTIRVGNVHLFKGHIACDSASNAEIVIPIIINNKCTGVLDIDSTEFDRFTEEDEIGLKNIVKAIESVITFQRK